MCGIAGIVNFNEAVLNTDVIRRMTDRIAHRGPDAEGIYTDQYIALGHRRLSIIDLSEAANQPMWDYSGRYVIVFNGEIYNYQQLKNQLPAYPYKTHSDGEVILAYFEAFGADALKHLNGMFAFAIWDVQKRRLFVARDRLGKKPFYFYQDNHYFIFSSEVRSLLASGLIERKLEESYITEYLLYQAAMDHHTLVKGVQRLKAGHYAWVENGAYVENRYWSYEEIRPCEDDLSTIRTKTRDLFLDAVRLRMIADVPVGAFLSGGIDSSLVVACMAELSTQPVNTFTISFNEKEFDESDYAQKIANQYRTQHHRIIVRPEHFLESIEEILAAMDTPSGDGPNTYLVSKFTKESNIKVALSGLGGDELFAGYNKFLMYYRLMRNKWILGLPKFVRHQLATLLLSGRSGHKFNKAGLLLDLKEWNLATIYPILRRAYSFREIGDIVKVPVKEDHVERKLHDLDQQTGWMGSLSKCTIGEIETYTRDVLLRDTDQMSMAHALEVRVPFFDYRLIEYILSLPDKVKYPHTPKQLLVESLAPRLPREIIKRPKMGFTLPFEHWLKNELSGMVQQKIDYLAGRPEFHGAAIQQKWKDFKNGNSRIIWSRIWKLIVLADWLERNDL